MTYFFIVRGLPGSGKSTTAKMLQYIYIDTRHFEADQYFIINGEYRFDASKLLNAHAMCLNNTENSLASKKVTIVSNTFTTKKELRPYFELAKKYSVKPQVITCQGQFGSIHNVPEDKLKQMKDRFDFKCVDELFQEYFP